MITAAAAIAEPADRARLSAECRSAMTLGHSRDEVAYKQINIYQRVIKARSGAEMITARR
jgi:hypothetical protein